MHRISFTLTLMAWLTFGCAGLNRGTNDGWIALFDGQSLNGWKVNENRQSVRVEDGLLICQGPRAHLFYTGDVQNASFRNFELQADIMTWPGANSGIYFHTEFQEEGWPEKGYEVQINNTYRGSDNYRELKKTGSLYAVRNMLKTLVRDNEWFNLHLIVRGKRIQVNVNGILVVDYVEPDNPPRIEGLTGRLLGAGTFALQCHDPDSRVAFRNIRVKPLPDKLPPEPVHVPVVNENYALIDRLNAENFPLIDSHVHLKGNLTLEDALARSREAGIFYGIAANCGLGFPITDDKGVIEYLESMKNQPVFVAMQAEGREWLNMFSREAIEKFDYVFSDALTFIDDNGKRIRLWVKEEVDVKDREAFMDMYVNRILKVLNTEPIDIFVNPTFLPAALAAEYDALWTEERMQQVIDAAVKNRIAIEINARYEIPSARFIKLAKKSGAKFAFGTNNGDENYGNLEYCLEIFRECELTGTDMWMPGVQP